jgi:hypothetical protein
VFCNGIGHLISSPYVSIIEGFSYASYFPIHTNVAIFSSYVGYCVLFRLCTFMGLCILWIMFILWYLLVLNIRKNIHCRTLPHTKTVSSVNCTYLPYIITVTGIDCRLLILHHDSHGYSITHLYLTSWQVLVFNADCLSCILTVIAVHWYIFISYHMTVTVVCCRLSHTMTVTGVHTVMANMLLCQ